MPWRCGILAALLAWLILASPAAAQVQRHTDSRGVIHIGNVAPRPPEPSQVGIPATIPEANADLQDPLSPAVQASLLKSDQGASPESDLAAIQKVCQGLARGDSQAHEFDGIIAAAQQAAAEKETQEAEADYNYLPVKKVSLNQGVMPTMTPRPVASQTAQVSAAGGIRRYRDAQGVWHISNAAPGSAEPGPAVQMAASPNVPGDPPMEQASSEPRLPIRQAAWNPDERRLASLPATSAPARKAPAGPSPIRQYRDSHGVIHISNVDPDPPQAAPALGLMARNRSNEEFDSQGLRPSPTLAMGGWALEPVAWNGEGGIKPLKRARAPAQNSDLTTEGGIRRHRDKNGVIHIKTVEYALPPGVVLPPRQAAFTQNASVAAAPLAPALRGPPTLANSLGSPDPGLSANPPASSGAGAQITAFKDAKGRLRITTSMPQPEAGKILPPMALKPELEPLIQEAAQIHRLPPSLIRAVIKVESDFCSWAVSPKGAMGLMQLMPGTANLLGVREPFNPRDNILGGCRYLRDLINLFGGNLPLALASYNSGYQRVIDCGYQIPAIKETQDFVTQVMGRYVTEEKRGHQPWT